MRSARIAELPVPLAVRDAVAAFVRAMTEEAGDRVEDIVVYGSAVRGEYGPDSDVDVLVYWGGQEAEARDVLARITTDVLAEYGVLVNAFPMDHAHRARVAEMDTRFHRAVQAEGVLVHG